jgi:hypothetical protein
MSGRHRDRSRLLSWYPHAWRERYGEEMLALIDDEIGADEPGLRLRLSLVAHGLAERTRGAGMVGPATSRETDRRRGALLVLVAWSAFMVAGAGYSKVAEHFDAAVPAGAHPLPQVAYDLVVAFGVLGGILVLAGAAIAFPGFLRILRAGAWPALRAHVVRATALSAITVALVIPLALWAHHLSDHQRNGGSVGYSAAFLASAGLVIVSITLWTAVAVAVGRRVELSPRALRVEAGLALGLATVMVVVTAASVVWWIGMAVYAPSFVNGLPLAVAVGLMLVGLAVSGVGVRRIVRA